MNDQLPRAIHDLEQEFAGLAGEIPESPEKRAISLLHGIVMEMWRTQGAEASANAATARDHGARLRAP